MYKCLAIVGMLALSLSAFAYDFYKSIGGGNRLYFNIVDDQSVEVTCPNTQQGNPYGDFLKPIGRVVIPSTVVYDGISYAVVAIGSHAFEGCDDMKAVTIPASVRRISAAAFRDCRSLRMLNIEAVNLDEVDMPFIGCDRLDSLLVSEEVCRIPSFAFCDIDSLKVVAFNAAQPDRMRNIFYGSRARVKLVVGPNVKRIPDEMCYNFVGLQSVEGGSGLTYIGREAFYYCIGLDSVTLPQSLTQLGAYAFSQCRPNRLTIRCTQVPQMAADPFMGVDARTYVVVPCGTRSEWLASVVGRHFERLHYAAGCGSDAKGRSDGEYPRDTVYVYDTVWLHDTVVVHDTVYCDEVEPDDTLLYYVEGRTLIMENIEQIIGKSYLLYDDRGRVVASGHIPATATERYAIRLPRKKRYYMQLQGLAPIAVDVER